MIDSHGARFTAGPQRVEKSFRSAEGQNPALKKLDFGSIEMDAGDFLSPANTPCFSVTTASANFVFLRTEVICHT